VVAGIGDEDVLVGIEGEAAGSEELALVGAGGTPFSEEVTVLVERDNLTGGLVGEVEVFVGVGD